jgi:diguanylate cyclase
VGRPAQFGTRIMRRVVALFMLCALLPVAVTLLLAYDRVESALLSQRLALLRGTASGYGTSLIERLIIAESLAGHMADEIAAGRAPRGPAYQGYFLSAVVVQPGAGSAAFGRPAGGVAEDAPGARRLFVARQGIGEPSVWLVVRGAAGPAMALQLDPAFLWKDDGDLPFLTDVCVLDAASAPLHCSRGLPESALLAVRQRLALQSRGEADWEDNDAHYFASYSEIFLRGRYAVDSWTVLATQPAEYALAPVEAVKQLMVPVVALGLLVAALLGLVQVRRTLGPLKELSDATARIAVRDFDVRLDASRDDEFGALARAFNSMSARLAIQFKALLAHAEIDAVILSNFDLPRVAAIVLKRTAELVSSERQYLLLADPASKGAYRLYSAAAEGRDGAAASLSGEDIHRLLRSTNGIEFAPSDSWSRVEGLAHLPGRSIFALPIPLGYELGGAIVLAYDEARRPGGGDMSILWKLADRVAVALATAKRDLELHRRAYYDPLTQLPNRVLGMEELERAVSQSARHRRVLAVLFVDLDGFSDVNDSLGHDAGDQLLQQAATRLRGSVRKSDVVMRLGGDEFAVILPELNDPADAAVAARHLVAELSQPFRLPAGEAFVSASVGVALHPGDAAGAEELLRSADLAMYSAKQAGRGQVAFFQASMNEEVRRRVELERELRDALERKQFELHYQPQLDLRTGRVCAAEGLLRWRHPVRGLVRPAEFVAFAESSGLIEKIGEWVLGEACAQLRAWREQGLPIEYVAVNVSPRQFRKPGLANQVAAILKQHELAPGLLHLEITEGALFDDQPSASANFSALTALGVALELDDFGTGYSSLARLQRLPVAVVKLDRSFIGGIERNAGAQAVVRAAIDMSHALGKYVVAEGVEDAAQLSLLKTPRSSACCRRWAATSRKASISATRCRRPRLRNSSSGTRRAERRPSLAPSLPAWAPAPAHSPWRACRSRQGASPRMPGRRRTDRETGRKARR